MPSSTTFSFTEEAFLLSSLQEVVMVWARGSGQANFDLRVIDGVADLNLNFRLGHPSDLHCAPTHNVPPPYQDQDQAAPVLKKRRKSAARRERDRARAQAFQAGREAGSETEQPSLILPFSGKMLPIKKFPNTESTAAPADDAPQVAAAPVVTTQEAASQEIVPTAATPSDAAPPPAVLTRRILTHSTQKNYIDVNVAKKQLFTTPVKAPPSSQKNEKKSYKMKEEDLWTKLFR